MTVLGLRRTVAAVLLTGLVTLAGGCGGETARTALPDLSAKLTAVDQALDLHRYGVARLRLKELLRDTVEARNAGDLDAPQANRILASIAELTAALPAPVTPAPSPSVTPRPTPKPAATTTHTSPKRKHGKHGKHGERD